MGKKPRTPGVEEAAALRLVEFGLSAAGRHHDDGSAPSMYDLHLDLPDGRAVAVEVTTLTDPVAEQHEALQLDRHAAGEPVSTLATSWKVVVQHGTRLSGFAADAEPLLADLERREILSVHHLPARYDLASVRELSRRGVTALLSWPTKDPRIFFSTMVGWTSSGPEDIVGELETFLATPSIARKVQKLETDAVDERHLFVWIRVFRGRAHRALRWDRLPTAHPALPESLTGIWVAIDGGYAWFFDARGGSWHRIDLGQYGPSTS